MPFSTPLQEAVAELNFAQAPVLEFRAASLYDAIRDRFPNYRRLPFFLVPVEAAAGAPMYSPAYQFISEDEQRVVQYGPRIFSYNALRYDGWAAFKEQSLRLFADFAAVGSGAELERLALTYINRMPAQTPQELQKLLAIDIGVTANTTPIEFAISLTDEGEHGLSTTRITPLPPDAAHSSSAFGITCAEVMFVKATSEGASAVDCASWFEAAHDRAKGRFWQMLSSEVQKNWEETYAKQSA